MTNSQDTTRPAVFRGGPLRGYELLSGAEAGEVIRLSEIGGGYYKVSRCGQFLDWVADEKLQRAYERFMRGAT